MNIFLRDPSLSSLLKDVRYRFPPSFISCVSFRKHERTQQETCGSCRFCRVCASSLEVASLICRILASGFRDLSVFLIADEDQDVYSTFMLDYLRSLYTLVIQTHSRYKYECGIYAPDDGVGVLNHKAYNLTILPVHNWRRLLDEGASSAVFGNSGKMRFLFIDGCKYIFEDFYSELKARNELEGTVGRLASCACSDADHHVLRHQRSSNNCLPNGSSSDPPSDTILQEDLSHVGESSSQRMTSSVTLVKSDRCDGLSDMRELDCLALSKPCDEGCAVRDVLFFDNVICGGTFDCLHFGHKYLLLVAFLSCRQSLHIGITASDALLHRKSDYSLIQSYDTRLEAVERYLCLLKLLYEPKRVKASTLSPDFTRGARLISYNNCDFFSCSTEPLPLPHCGEFCYREFLLSKSGATPSPKEPASGVSVTTFKLMDIYGPADILDDSFALVISPESLPGAEQVNAYRRSKGLLGWLLLSGGFVLHPEFECNHRNVEKVSSSRIRSSLKSMS